MSCLNYISIDCFDFNFEKLLKLSSILSGIPSVFPPRISSVISPVIPSRIVPVIPLLFLPWIPPRNPSSIPAGIPLMLHSRISSETPSRIAQRFFHGFLLGFILEVFQESLSGNVPDFFPAFFRDSGHFGNWLLGKWGIHIMSGLFLNFHISLISSSCIYPGFNNSPTLSFSSWKQADERTISTQRTPPAPRSGSKRFRPVCSKTTSQRKVFIATPIPSFSSSSTRAVENNLSSNVK